jgi:hypothetical protein
MLEWPHSGFHVHDGVLAPEDDPAFALRLARYCARNPVALERLEYAAPANRVRYRSDKRDGPTAGTETVDPLEFLARVTAHIPDQHQVMTRYYGWYANRTRGKRRQRAGEGSAEAEPSRVAAGEALPLREARRRWADLLRRVFEVEPLRCPACVGPMRIVAFLTEREAIDRILHSLRRPRPPPLPARVAAPAAPHVS